ncbi:MAG: hypothetical protein EOP82_14285 [Variovorax sp.]|nr:MAG: hypothetical protein EOP82_14285 [Variovorax sp.]
MKLALAALVIAVSGCASQPPPPPAVSAVGPSQLAPKSAATCVAQKWATNSGQTVYMQHVFANDTAFDVYVPGQQPPTGSAALVRPATSGPGSMVSYRGDATNVTGPVGQCQ